MFRRRRLDQATIAKLADDNADLRRELAGVRDLLARRTQALLATERENEALHHALKELGEELHAPKPQPPTTRGPETQPMTRQRSDKGGPQWFEAGELVTPWKPS